MKVWDWLNPRPDLSELPPLVDKTDGLEQASARVYQRSLWRAALLNAPLVLGSVIVLGLFLLVLFGPVWAPSNPYLAGQNVIPHFDSEAQVWITPPLSPSPEYPLGTDEWGNDILSLLMYGARNTLIVAAFIAMARILVGLMLGAYAGWNEGGGLDQLIMGGVGVLSAVPMLISSIIIVYALDIRQGIPVFIIALTLVGWGEIAQYIRSEFLVLRQMPYIEGARAVGARNVAIAVRHILPNLLPQLLVITFLEVGAVLLLLGELSFVGVFIGGGSRIALGDELTGLNVVTLAEVPEWGAMLAQGYRWLRAKPFIVFPPAIAFFVAVVGFNALGEGLRRFIEQYHVSTNFLLRKRMVVVIGGLCYATVFIINSTGPAPWLAQVARAFRGDLAYEHVMALADMEGRGVGQHGGRQAADYIAAQFEAVGLQPGWRQSAYIFPNETRLVRPLSQPRLTINGVERGLQHQLDFGFIIEGHGGSGVVERPLSFVGFVGESPTWEAYRGLDLRERIVLVMADTAPPDFASEALIRGAEGVLWIVDDEPDSVRSQFQLVDGAAAYVSEPTLPIFRIRRQVAQMMLAEVGLTLDHLLLPNGASQQGRGWYRHDVAVTVGMSVELSEPEETAVPAVIGSLPGSDFEIANELVVVVATYDGLGIDPDGTIFPAANHNGAGVGVMLELARLWQEQSLAPRRSVWFVAWGGSTLDSPGLTEFLNDPRSIRHLPAQASTSQLRPRVIVQMNYAGAGSQPEVTTLFVHPSSSPALTNLVQESAKEIELEVVGKTAQPTPVFRNSQANWLYLAWQEDDVSPEADVAERIDGVRLQLYGEVVSHVLTQVVRQARY